jgi:hypothetical protein
MSDGFAPSRYQDGYYLRFQSEPGDELGRFYPAAVVYFRSSEDAKLATLKPHSVMVIQAYCEGWGEDPNGLNGCVVLRDAVLSESTAEDRSVQKAATERRKADWDRWTAEVKALGEKQVKERAANGGGAERVIKWGTEQGILLKKQEAEMDAGRSESDRAVEAARLLNRQRGADKQPKREADKQPKREADRQAKRRVR